MREPIHLLTEDERRFIIILKSKKFSNKSIAFCLGRCLVTIENVLKS